MVMHPSMVTGTVTGGAVDLQVSFVELHNSVKDLELHRNACPDIDFEGTNGAMRSLNTMLAIMCSIRRVSGDGWSWMKFIYTSVIGCDQHRRDAHRHAQNDVA